MIHKTLKNEYFHQNIALSILQIEFSQDFIFYLHLELFYFKRELPD